MMNICESFALRNTLNVILQLNFTQYLNLKSNLHLENIN